MTKFFQILLVAVYVLLTSYAFIGLLKIWGLPISRNLTIGLLFGWMVYCFSSASFRAGNLLAHIHVRKPVKEEEDKLNSHFQEVLQQAGIVKTFRLLIQEEMGYNAFAIGLRTIVVSRGLLEGMEPGELKAVLAHELGHLQSNDCLISSAFSAANFLPWIVTVVYEKVKHIFLRGFIFSVFLFRVRVSVLLLVLLVGLSFFWYSHSLLPLLATILFVLTFRRVSSLFLFLWKMISRFTEYKQDAYACQLGYGTALRQALFKVTLNEPQSVGLYEILMRSDHPVIYNRIRRLEKLEGLR